MTDLTEPNETPLPSLSSLPRRREFLLDNGSRLVSATRDSTESMIGREVPSDDGHGAAIKCKIVQELTEPVTELSEFEHCLQQISPEAVAKEREEGEARRKAWEEAEHECDEDYLKPCEGTIPICCATDLSPEFMNRFISLNTYKGPFNMVFIDDLSTYYSAETTTPVQQPSSPFKGKPPHECYLLLRQLVKDTGSQINWQEFTIIDEQSLQDNTVILGSCPVEDGGEAIWIRAAMGLASHVFALCMVGYTDLEEIISEVHEDQGIGGVLRFLPGQENEPEDE